MFTGRPAGCPSIRCPSVRLLTHTSHDASSLLCGEVSMKLGINIHHVRGVAVKVFKVRVQRSPSSS